MRNSKFALLLTASTILLLAASCQKDEIEIPIHPRGSKVIVISDIHLNDHRSQLQEYGWMKDGINAMVGFLDSLASEDSVGTLVVNGDLFDEWVAPITNPPFIDANGNTTQSESDYFRVLVRDNQPVINAFKRLRAAGCKIVFIPGNHDMEITANDLERELPGLFTQARDADGLGSYTPEGMDEVIIEHGHRYDFFNAPDPQYKQGRLIPPGFMVSKYAATIDQETRRNGEHYSSNVSFNLEGIIDADDPYNQYLWDSIVEARHLEDELDGMGLADFCTYYSDIVNQLGDFLSGQLSGDTPQFNFFCYQAAWGAVMLKYHHRDEKKNIETLLSTIQLPYPFQNHLFFNVIPLYNGFPEEYNEECQTEQWMQRCRLNRVAVDVSLYESILSDPITAIFDNMANRQYFDNPQSQKRIVVFGHSHKEKLEHKLDNNGQCCIYANTGTWIDPFYAGKGQRTHTYIEITKNKKNYCVQLKQYPYTNPIKTLLIKR